MATGATVSPPRVSPASCLLPLSPVVLNNIARGIFEAIVEQAPFAIEDLLNELGEEEASEGAEQEQGVRSEEAYGKPEGRGHGVSDVTGATRPGPRRQRSCRGPCTHLLSGPLFLPRPGSQAFCRNKRTRRSPSWPSLQGPVLRMPARDPHPVLRTDRPTSFGTSISRPAAASLPSA